jgi:biopolymer transport protein ExbD
MRRRRYELTEDDSEINMTPMLDIVFIMLIFFIVTSSFIKESGVEVERPAAATATRQEHGNILIAITSENAIWVDRREVEPSALGILIERLHAENPEGTVVVQADQGARAGLLVQVIDQARRAGVEDVAIAAELIEP